MVTGMLTCFRGKSLYPGLNLNISDFLIQLTAYFLEGYQYKLQPVCFHKLCSNNHNLIKQNLVPRTQFTIGSIVECYLRKTR